VPLALGASGQRLLFASNLDRETFGIYEVDLATQQLSELVIEHPTQDLYMPRPGLFPDPGVAIRSDFRLTRDDLADAEIWDEEGVTLESAADEDVSEDARWTQAYRRFLARMAIASTRRPLGDPSPLVFDRFTGELVGLRMHGSRLTTMWFRPELAQAQAILERELAGRHVEIREWDKKYETLLVLTHGPSHPGAFGIFHRSKTKFVEFAARTAPARADKAEVPNRSVPFACEGPGGTRLTGTLTFPRAVRDTKAARVPLAVLCPTEPWRPFTPTYSPEVQALARMGLAVARINTRGMWGSGVRNRQGLETGYDTVQSEDLIAALDHLGARFPVNLQRVVIVGEGLGGHLALRAAQVYPDRIRCAVAIEAPISLKAWLARSRWSQTPEALLLRPLFGTDATLEAEPLVRGAPVTRPVCVFAVAGDDVVPASAAHGPGRAFASRVEAAGTPAEFVGLLPDYLRHAPEARAAVFRRIEKFLNVHLYDYLVEVGEGQVVPEP